MTRWMHPPELEHPRARDRFDPVIEGSRYGLSRELSLAIWERVRPKATDSAGWCDLGRVQQRFQSIAARVAAGGVRLRPEVGKFTRAGDESCGDRRPSIIDELAPRVPGRTTLVAAEARRWALMERASSTVHEDAGTALDHTAPPGADTVVAAMAGLLVSHHVPGEFSAAARVAAAQARGQLVARSAEPGNSEVAPGAVASVFAAIDDTRGGERLPDELAHRLTHEIGVDLSQVRIHCDERAAQIAAQVGARALTVRSDIYFAAGAYDPTTPAGIELIAHEVMHVAQNARGTIALDGRAVSRPEDTHERQAVSFASQFISARQPARPGVALGHMHIPAVASRGGGPSLGDRIDRAPARGGPDEMWHEMFHGKSIAVGKLAHVAAPKGIILKAQPAPFARPVSAIIGFDHEVFVVRTTTEGDVAKRWAFVTVTGSGTSGFIEERHLALDPPEPRATLYIVHPDETLGTIVQNNPNFHITGGNDTRLYVQAIYELNKGRPGVKLAEVHLSRLDTMPRKEAEEETLKVYRGIRIITDPKRPRVIWIPGEEFVQQLKASGKITSGSTEIMKEGRKPRRRSTQAQRSQAWIRKLRGSSPPTREAPRSRFAGWRQRYQARARRSSSTSWLRKLRRDGWGSRARFRSLGRPHSTCKCGNILTEARSVSNRSATPTGAPRSASRSRKILPCQMSPRMTQRSRSISMEEPSRRMIATCSIRTRRRPIPINSMHSRKQS